jgi:arginyl-tRNA synthetase
MNIFKKELVLFIRSIIKEKKDIQISEEESYKLLKQPPDDSFGDYSLASYYLAKHGFKGKPEDIAGEVFDFAASNFAQIKSLFDKVEIKGAYVNFFVNKEKFVSYVIKDVVCSGSDYGRTPPKKPLRIVIDFSSPNIAKPFGVGHLRSTDIGMSLSNIYEFGGHSVKKINYLGDFGTQFGKLITAFCRYYEDIDFSEFEKDPIKILYGLYVRIHKDEQADGTVEEEAKQRFKTLEDYILLNKRGFENYLTGLKNAGGANKSGAENEDFAAPEEIKISEENKAFFCGTPEGQHNLWKIFRRLSIDEFKRIYESIGIKFDEYEGEALSAEFSNDIKEILLESGIAEISEGAAIVNVEPLKTPALIAKSDGTSLYLSRDIVTAVSRMAKYNFDRMIYVVGSEQALHFSQLSAIFSILKNNADKIKNNPNFKSYASMIDGRIVHVKFGRIIGMSTRKGNLVFLSDYIEEAKLKAKEKLKESGHKIEPDQAESTSLKIGIGAIIFNDLKTRRTTDVNFNWDNVLSFEGQTGPYLQYTVSRINSLIYKLDKSKTLNLKSEKASMFSDKDADFNDIFLIAKHISYFENAAGEAIEQNEPSVLSSYALELASYFNAYYQNHRLSGNDFDYIEPRLYMLLAVRTVLKQILNLLCIPILERM